MLEQTRIELEPRLDVPPGNKQNSLSAVVDVLLRGGKRKEGSEMNGNQIARLLPLQYLHILDLVSIFFLDTFHTEDNIY